MSIADDASAALADGQPVDKGTLRAVFAEISGALPDGQSLALVSARVQQLEDLAPSTLTRIQSLRDDLNNEVAAFTGSRDATNKTVADFVTETRATEAGLDQRLTAVETQSTNLQQNVEASYLLYGGIESRPGEAGVLFCDGVAGGDPRNTSTTLPGASVAGLTGPALRLTTPAVLAPRAMFPLEAGRSYRMRLAVRRTLDTRNPIGDGIVFGVAFYNGSRASLGTVTPSGLTLPLTVLDGPVTLAAVVALDARQGVDIVAPVGAAYARPFVETFSSGQQTDVSVLGWSDISDAGLIAPDVDALAAAVATLSARVAALPASPAAQASP